MTPGIGEMSKTSALDPKLESHHRSTPFEALSVTAFH